MQQIVASGAASIDYVNTFGLLDLAVADPAAYGLTNVTQPVWTGNLTDSHSGVLNATGAAQNGHLFFDDLHPTAAGHTLLADAVTQGLTGERYSTNPGRTLTRTANNGSASERYRCAAEYLSVRNKSGPVRRPRPGSSAVRHGEAQPQAVERVVSADRPAGPALNTIPASAAGLTSLRTSMLSGSLIHRKMPPFGAQHSADAPNSRATASVIVSNLSRSTPFRCCTWLSKVREKYSATTIWSSAPVPLSPFSGSRRRMMSHPAIR